MDYEAGCATPTRVRWRSWRLAAQRKLDELRAVLQQGSRGSRVDAVEEKEMDEGMAEGLESFRIEGAW